MYLTIVSHNMLQRTKIGWIWTMQKIRMEVKIVYTSNIENSVNL